MERQARMERVSIKKETSPVNISAVNTVKLLGNQGLNLFQPLGRDAVPDSIVIGSKSYETEKVLKVCILLLDGLIANTFSPDVMYLAAHSARHHGKLYGIDEATLDEILPKLQEHMEQVRGGNPLAGMF